MADKNPEANLSKIVLLMRVAFGKGSAVNERMTAIDRINDCLKGDGLDIHDLTARLENSSALTKAEVKKIYDKGRADEAEEQKRRAVTVPPVSTKPFFSSRSFNASSFSNTATSTATAYVGGRDGGPGGYSWGEIANYCAAHINRFPEKHREFVGDMADELNGGGRMSGKQAKYLGNLFNQYLGGRIK